MEPIEIIPQYKLLISYNIIHETQQEYYRFVLGDFVPAVQDFGLYMHMAWHIAYGSYPMRQLVFITDNSNNIHQVLASADYTTLEDELRAYTTHFSRKLVRYRKGYQV